MNERKRGIEIENKKSQVRAIAIAIFLIFLVVTVLALSESNKPESIEKNRVMFKEVERNNKQIVFRQDEGMKSQAFEAQEDSEIYYSELPFEVSANRIKLYSLDNGRKEVDIEKKDLNNNGLIDNMEWQYSSSDYELIIEISKAEHLDENKTVISDIYENVKAKDGNWSEAINNNEYVRVTFNQNLTSKNDITIYARLACEGVVSINGTDVPCGIYLKKLRIEEIRRERENG